MPPEAKESSQFIRDFYDMKSDVEVIKSRLEDCSLVKGKCASHHDFITSQEAVKDAQASSFNKFVGLVAVVNVITILLLKIIFHI